MRRIEPRVRDGRTVDGHALVADARAVQGRRGQIVPDGKCPAEIERRRVLRRVGSVRDPVRVRVLRQKPDDERRPRHPGFLAGFVFHRYRDLHRYADRQRVPGIDNGRFRALYPARAPVFRTVRRHRDRVPGQNLPVSLRGRDCRPSDLRRHGIRRPKPHALLRRGGNVRSVQRDFLNMQHRIVRFAGENYFEKKSSPAPPFKKLCKNRCK